MSSSQVIADQEVYEVCDEDDDCLGFFAHETVDGKPCWVFVCDEPSTAFHSETLKLISAKLDELNNKAKVN